MRDTINLGAGVARLESIANSLMGQAALFLAERTKQHAPIDTGLLRSSVQIFPSAFHEWTVTVMAPYAVFVEFGHFNGLRGSGYVPPNPFFRRALADTIAEFPRLASVISTAEFDATGATAVGSRAWTSVPDAGGFQSNFAGKTTPGREFYAGKMEYGPNIGVTF